MHSHDNIADAPPRICISGLDSPICIERRKRRKGLDAFRRGTVLFPGFDYQHLQDSRSLKLHKFRLKEDGGKFVRRRYKKDNPRILGIAAVSATHYAIHSIMRHRNTAYVVYEDDTFSNDPHTNFDPGQWPTDGVTIFACSIAKITFSSEHRFEKTVLPRAKATIQASEDSGNRTIEIDYSLHGWWGTFCYFVPNSEIANKIVTYIDSLQSINNFDSQMSFQGKTSYQSALPNETPIFKYLATPALCYMDDQNLSATQGKLVGISKNHIYSKRP